MNQFKYQCSLAAKVLESIESNSKPVCMAVTTSAGKSATTVRILEGFLKNKPNRTAVFLGSNQTVLAKQFFDTLSNDCPVPFSFSFSMINDERRTQLKIGLPQQLIKKPLKISLLVLDEAQLLWPQTEHNPNSLMSQILKLCQPEKILLLTGSPSYFTARKTQYVLHYLSYEDIVISKSRVFSKVDLDLIVTESDDVEAGLKVFWRSAKHKRSDISQLAVVAKDIKQAEIIKKILEAKYRLKTVISTSQHDSDSLNLDIFKTGDFDCCVTVNRIFTGWSYNNLTAVLDFSATQNLNRSFQLMSRLLRVKNEATVKNYYRVCLQKNVSSEIHFLFKIKALLSRDNFINFTGNNLRTVIT